ncbi:DUF4973 domain-containing protein [Pararcticibacter amylolyticus]|uniref:DUF4973 domain-containing protein n=1 Tax=Pararcticibacter amylolyticus TaxID=2173175 RepID=A0A2U2PMN7_9SPHI|nr:DUF4973 domain-containing protein [Pararcticibacter amylolyticus]PWG82588.1 hypothetical protein DDR33_01630 [Pararcticibacter amylolyticus]
MKKSYIQIFLLSLLIICGSCNDEWKDEQYRRYIGFKAPLSNEGVTNIFVRYKDDEKTTFLQPLIVSGSTVNDKDITVHIGLDPDTLKVLNFERFQSRTDFYYKELNSNYFSMPQTVDIKAGENTALLPIDFTFKDIDLVDKWVLPLTIQDDRSYGYTAHPRKNYRKALLRVNPFNDYSGSYSGTALKTAMVGHENETALVKNEIRTYVADENTIFLYAGNIDEERQDRHNYKIFFTFSPTGTVSLRADNPAIKFKINKDASYTISEQMDAVRPYLKHRYITINNIDYNYTDYTRIAGVPIEFHVAGSLILERKLNTQIPDEDQAIEW